MNTIKLGKWELENDIDCKCIPDGWEIFGDAVNRLGISPEDFTDAYWGMFDSIIIEKI